MVARITDFHDRSPAVSDPSGICGWAAISRAWERMKTYSVLVARSGQLQRYMFRAHRGEVRETCRVVEFCDAVWDDRNRVCVA